MTDAELAVLVNDFMSKKTYLTLNTLRVKFKVSTPRLKRLEAHGLLTKKLPSPMSKSACATLNNKKNNPMKGWYISKPTVFDGPKPN